MTIRPIANQTSCRTTTLPPARPTWRLASVTVLITTSPNAVTSSSQSTFCSRRRSIRSTSRRSPPPRSSRRRSHSGSCARSAPRPGRLSRRARRAPRRPPPAPWPAQRRRTTRGPGLSRPWTWRSSGRCRSSRRCPAPESARPRPSRCRSRPPTGSGGETPTPPAKARRGRRLAPGHSRPRDRMVEVDRAVAALLPVLERRCAKMKLAVAVGPVERSDAAFLQARGRHEDLEHGAVRVLGLDRTVQQRKVRILDHAHPRIAIDRASEAIDLERRRRHHREDVAAARIHDDDRAGQAVHGALGGLLDAAIDRRDHLRPSMRLGLLHPPDRAAHRVDLDPLAAVLTAQVLVEEALEAALADHLAPPVSPLLELLVVGLAA